MTFNLDGEPLSGKPSVWSCYRRPCAAGCRPTAAAATLISRKQRRRPAGIQQPGSLIEPLNVG